MLRLYTLSTSWTTLFHCYYNHHTHTVPYLIRVGALQKLHICRKRGWPYTTKHLLGHQFKPNPATTAAPHTAQGHKPETPVGGLGIHWQGSLLSTKWANNQTVILHQCDHICLTCTTCNHQYCYDFFLGRSYILYSQGCGCNHCLWMCSTLQHPPPSSTHAANHPIKPQL